MASRTTKKHLVAATKNAARRTSTNPKTQPSNITIKIDMPVCSQADYGNRLGLTPGAVRGHVERRLVPTVKIGKHRFINVAKLTLQCLEAGSDE